MSRLHSAPLTPPRLHEVADGVFAYVQPDGGWCLNNAGVVVGRHSVTVVDTAATQRRAEHLAASIRSIASVPPRTVINTHFHGDHTFGNCVFEPDVEIISSESTRREVIDTGFALQQLWPEVAWGQITLTPPTLTFHDRLTLYRDGERIELLHLGPAHTASDVVVWLPGRGVLFTGDVCFAQCTPFVLMGSVSGALAELQRLRELGATTIVPGHGPVGGPEILDANEAYLRWLVQTAQRGISAELSPLEAARQADLGEFAELLDAERLVPNLHRAYAEESGAPPGTPMDVVSIFQEMVAHRGGLPTCRA